MQNVRDGERAETIAGLLLGKDRLPLKSTLQEIQLMTLLSNMFSTEIFRWPYGRDRKEEQITSLCVSFLVRRANTLAFSVKSFGLCDDTTEWP